MHKCFYIRHDNDQNKTPRNYPYRIFDIVHSNPANNFLDKSRHRNHSNHVNNVLDKSRHKNYSNPANNFLDKSRHNYRDNFHYK